MAGVENQIGIGMAQVLPKPASMMPLVEQLNQQKQQKFAREKYDQQQKEQNDKELYGLVGDALNLRDFNPVIHDKVRQAQVELAQKLKSEKPSYGDAYIAAQNKASELGMMSQTLNQADQVIAATKKEYEADKRINTGNIEMLARQKILNQIKKNGKIDPSINYFDEALNEYPQFALTDNGEFSQHHFLPEEKQNLFGKFKDVNKRGGFDQFDWKVDGVIPAFYDFKDNGENAAPLITVKSKPSGLVDANKNPIPMLSDEAYGRFSATPSNIIDINRRIKKAYGDAINLKSEEAEILRKIEAYKEVEKMMPKINKSRIEKADPIKYFGGSTTVNLGSGSNVNDVVGRMKSTIQEDVANGFNVTRFNKLKSDEQTLIKDFINKDLSQEDKYKGDDIFVSLNANDEIEVYKKSALEEGKNPNTLITTLPGNLANLKAKQAGANENRAIVAEGNKDNQKPSGKTPKYKGLDKNGNPIFE